MRAVLSNEVGGPETLVVAEVDEPAAGPGEVVIAVEAAALNFMDTLIIRDRYQVKPARPFSPSAECAGRIAALGAGVEGLAVGERVLAYVGHGAAREKVVAPARVVVPVPDAVPADVAAGLSVAYGTTVHALRDRGRLAAGETLVVTGATGGVGQAAVEIGKLMGARVIACVGGPDKVAAARALGADDVVDLSAGDPKEAVKALTGGAGADVVYDAVGADLVDPLVRATAWGGRYLVIGFAGGDIPKLALNLVLLKSIDVVGVHWGRWTERDPAGQAANMRWLLAEVAAGRLRPTVHARYALEDTAAALAEIEARRVRGKVVLVP
ncbi:NADPH:quinone oxidoreductase family protein [Oharaeibacter diazotrophicus]|uniref:NADPH2:quinone reductase n=3 Tax=Oharaeibacter diazotrophicus TaxID=1920512 RepID=A0A4R6RD43_9HYPH|nr:NADPH:quinone oxidoreductase family protein [Oharaeibacter diazotrophicus]TDP83965.1 NADPH2:quinone reductase [Oharaeibacter diazotrophicus]BBE73004.1 phthiocerol synthesis polyketide synthase type IPpsC [Pleomorphomonas sp. SM30]GLS74792.1 NADPH:quinone oxidoreductase [Oharaeibacter diazotrophicus]